MSIGVPIKVMHEAEGHIVTIETNIGETYRGKLLEAEDNMNCQMQEVMATYRDGSTGHLPEIYIRGSKIRFMILPDMLKNAPMFKKYQTKQGGGGGRGRGGPPRGRGGRGGPGRGGRGGPPRGGPGGGRGMFRGAPTRH
ncbi:unnamed protein product [Gordionus sp. m RMFG-2023]|uniref:small nuclear ribonucleoprotein Sm D3-like n=1 Tax=Gordionus sp. m RMFG-2023 TaxID=3053472 RepID=UPI0030E06D3C